jgi:hypothetical protein
LRFAFSALSLQAVEESGVVFLFCLPQLPALQKCVRQQRIASHCFLDPWKEAVKVVLDQILKQAGRNCAAEILIGAAAPLKDE